MQVPIPAFFFACVLPSGNQCLPARLHASGKGEETDPGVGGEMKHMSATLSHVRLVLTPCPLPFPFLMLFAPCVRIAEVSCVYGAPSPRVEGGPAQLHCWVCGRARARGSRAFGSGVRGISRLGRPPSLSHGCYWGRTWQVGSVCIGLGSTTNNVAEYSGLIAGLQVLPPSLPLPPFCHLASAPASSSKRS